MADELNAALVRAEKAERERDEMRAEVERRDALIRSDGYEDMRRHAETLAAEVERLKAELRIAEIEAEMAWHDGPPDEVASLAKRVVSAEHERDEARVQVAALREALGQAFELTRAPVAQVDPSRRQSLEEQEETHRLLSFARARMLEVLNAMPVAAARAHDERVRREAQANLDPMAATPDLLEELKGIVWVCGPMGLHERDCPSRRNADAACSSRCTAARAAFAKGAKP